jgi:hypothetical protein
VFVFVFVFVLYQEQTVWKNASLHANVERMAGEIFWDGSELRGVLFANLAFSAFV